MNESVNARTRSKLIYGVDKLRMINSYLSISFELRIDSEVDQWISRWDVYSGRLERSVSSRHWYGDVPHRIYLGLPLLYPLPKRTDAECYQHPKEGTERRDESTGRKRTHDNMVTALLGTVLTKLIDNPL